MPKPTVVSLLSMTIVATTLGCGRVPERSMVGIEYEYVEPNWEKFRSVSFEQRAVEAPSGYRPVEGRFVFADLKYESDQSLSKRLVGALSSRIGFVDRHHDRWQYYSADDDPMRRITLFARPEPWGSAFGLCRSERYEISFNDDGTISSVDVSPRYGVEGPIFQKDNFDWDDFRGRMCDQVPANHTRSYFPVSDSVLDAQDLAILLSLAIDEAGRDGSLSYDLSCTTYDGKECQSDIRAFLSELRLHEIDAVSSENCIGDAYDCFTATVGEHELGPNPKHITIKGTSYMNEWRVQSINIIESFTIS
ncbi:MAG: hypothetical protein ABJN65_02085 [Parasphingorhabdus sp.]